MIPIGKNIIIKDINEEIKTDSGLILSGKDIDAMRYKKALVIASGTEVNSIKKGDIAYYDKAHGFTMFIEDVPHTIIQEHHVVVVL